MIQATSFFGMHNYRNKDFHLVLSPIKVFEIIIYKASLQDRLKAGQEEDHQPPNPPEQQFKKIITTMRTPGALLSVHLVQSPGTT